MRINHYLDFLSWLLTVKPIRVLCDIYMAEGYESMARPTHECMNYPGSTGKIFRNGRQELRKATIEFNDPSGRSS